MAIATGSLKTGLGTVLQGLMNNETSAARRFSNEQGISWYSQQNYMATALAALNGLTASTSDLNTGLGSAILASTGQVNTLYRYAPSTRAWALGVYSLRAPSSPGKKGYFIQATNVWCSGSFNWQCGGKFSRIIGAWGGPSTRGCGAMKGKGRCPTQQVVWVTTAGTGVRIQYYTSTVSTLSIATTGAHSAASLVLWGASTPTRTSLFAMGY